MKLAINAELFPILFSVLVIFVPVLILLIIVIIKFIMKNVRKNKEQKKNLLFDYEDYFGGNSNIINIDVKMSRVNVTVKDLELVKLDELKNQGMGILVVGNVIKCSSSKFAEMIENKTK